VADHRYYSQHGGYDFPRRQLSSLLLSWAARIPAVRRQLYGEEMKRQMVKSFRKLLEEI
jgi:hypothetical protein